MTPAGEITQYLNASGANLIGFADLTCLSVDVRHNLPRAVVFAIALAPDIVASIRCGPTKAYYAEYDRVNILLAKLSHSVADLLRHRGFTAIASAATNEGIDSETLSTRLPHKTTATLAGLGWIGKCALLVNEEFGAAIRLNRVLTDAPLPTGTPVTESRCGNCRACIDACPGMAATGGNWEPGKHRDTFFNAAVCCHTAREIAQRNTGISDTFCGMCIAACPWTQSYIKRSIANLPGERRED